MEQEKTSQIKEKIHDIPWNSIEEKATSKFKSLLLRQTHLFSNS